MKEIKRYCCGNGEGMFEDDKNGHWVEYSEHKAIIEALTEKLRQYNSGQSEQFHCERFDFGRDKKCEQQCSDCHWMQTKSQRSEQLVCPDCADGRDEFEPEWKCPDCRQKDEAN